MQLPSKFHSSKQINRVTLPSINRSKKQLTNTISQYLTEVNNSVGDFESSRYSLDMSMSPTQRHNLLNLKSMKIKKIPNKYRKSRFASNKDQAHQSPCSIVETINGNETDKSNQTFSYRQSLSLLGTSTSKGSNLLKRGKLLEKLKAIDEESNYVNRHMLTELSINEKQDKRLSGQYQKIIDEKKKVLSDTSEFLQPEYNHPFQHHSNAFYSVLDQVITKVNGTTSVDLFKKMKKINEEKKEKKKEKECVNSIKSQKRSERVEKILNESNLISSKLIKQEQLLLQKQNNLDL